MEEQVVNVATEDQPKRGPGRPRKTQEVDRAVESTETSDTIEARIRGLEARMMDVTGRRESKQMAIERGQQILNRIRERAKAGGKHHWRIINKRYQDGVGNPVSHDFYSDAENPQAAVADYNRRTGRSWDVNEGEDPVRAELVARNFKEAGK